MHALILTVILVVVLLFIAHKSYHIYLTKLERFSDQNHQHQVVLVYSKSCPHCVHFIPIFEKYKEANIHVNMLAIDASTSEGKRFKKIVSGYPTTVIVDQNNNLIGEPLVGATDYDVLAKYIQSNY